MFVVPVCGFCSHYKKDLDFPDLFGNCEYKPNYVSFRAPACRKWIISVGLDTVKNMSAGVIG